MQNPNKSFIDRKEILQEKLRLAKEKIAKPKADRVKRMQQNKIKKMTNDEKKANTQRLKEKRIASHLKKEQKEEENAPEATKKDDIEMLQEIKQERANRKGTRIQQHVTHREKRMEIMQDKEGDNEETREQKANERKNTSNRWKTKEKTSAIAATA